MGQHPPITPEQGLRVLKASWPQDFPTRLRTKRQKSVQNRGHLPSEPPVGLGPLHCFPRLPSNCLMGLALCVFSTPHPEWSVQKQGGSSREGTPGPVRWADQSHRQEFQA